MYLTTYLSNTQKTTVDYKNLMDSVIETPEYYKTTIKIDNPIPLNKLSEKQQNHIIKIEAAIEEAFELLADYMENPKQYYREFYIPKRSGGMRKIDAPNDDFKDVLSKVKDIFERKIKCLPHKCAFAYVKNTSVLDAMKEHQKNESNWYLKIDLHNFFPNCTPEIIYNNLMQLYPFYYIKPAHQCYLKTIIETCCLDNGLPQGTPMSPLLTNLLMVPVDYAIDNLVKRGLGTHHVYTRYADDIQISCKSKFYYVKLIEMLKPILAPFEINEEKTRYGSKAGRNWNLGLMTNKDNNITLGYRKKKILNAMLNNFLKDYVKDVKWSKTDVQVLQGQLSYLKHIEPGYYEYIMHKYTEMYQIDYSSAIRDILN